MSLRRTLLLLPLAVAACGGGEVENAPATGARKLSFAYFQRCVMPILVTQLPVTLNGSTTVNSCAAAGCHDDTNGTGGALRVRRFRMNARSVVAVPGFPESPDLLAKLLCKRGGKQGVAHGRTVSCRP